ncbi:anion permease [Pseudomonas putida]|nr:anion permease [Pseudomonas putida]
MTSLQCFAVGWLVLIFVVCIWRHVNLGLAMLPGAFVLAEVAGIPLKQLYQGFPTSLAILILGVMFLWNHARNSGLADIVITGTVEVARGKVWLLPWVTCGLSAVICAIGALPAAALVITLPVAIRMAEQEGIRPALMGIVTIQGACMGGFSPASPWGNLVIDQAKSLGMPFTVSQFVLAQVFLNFCVALAAFFIFGGIALLRRPPKSTAAQLQETRFSLNAYQWASLASLLSFISLVLCKYDVGLCAFALGLLLHIAFRGECNRAISALPWNIVIMIAGLIMYVSLLENLGVLQLLGEKLESVESPSLVLLALTYLGTLVANFEASSVAVLGLVIPVAAKALAGSESALSNSLALAMVSGSISVIASSPFHLCGGIVLAEARGCSRTLRDLLAWTLGASLLLPLFALLIHV